MDHRDVGFRAQHQTPGVGAEQGRRIARQQGEGARHVDHPVAHQREGERQERLGPGHARFGIGKGQALVFGPARVVARGDHVDRAIADRGDHRLAVGLSAQGRREAAERAEIDEFEVREHEVRRGHARRHPHAAFLGGAHQIECGCRGDLTDVNLRAGHFGQRNVARDGQRLGLGRGGGQAQTCRHFACGRHRRAGHPGILGMGDDDKAEHRAIGQEAQHHA